MFMNKFFFCLDFSRSLNKPKIKVHVWLVYKQTHMNKLFIEPTMSYLLITWFIYSPRTGWGF